jgi:hypothetical protein
VAPLQASVARVLEGKSRRNKKTAAAVSLLHLFEGRGPSGFQIFTSGFQIITKCYYGVTNVDIPRSRQKDHCLDGCLRRLFADFVRHIYEDQVEYSNGRARQQDF